MGLPRSHSVACDDARLGMDHKSSIHPSSLVISPSLQFGEHSLISSGVAFEM
jgi:hypothetical protein